MKHSIVILLLMGVALAGALFTGRPILYNLTYSLLGVTVLSYLWAWYNVSWVQVDRETLSSRAQVGNVAEERFLLRNRGPLPRLWLEVRDHSELPEHRASMVINALASGREHGWAVRTTCRRRGRFRLGPVSLVSGDPFGMFVQRRELTPTSSIVVFPLMVDLHRFGALSGELVGGGTMHRRTHYVTTNVAGVREYYPGDSFNRIHWPSTARTGRLIVKEFELDPTADVWLCVDMDRAVQAEQRLEVSFDKHGDLPVLPARRATALDPSTEEYLVAAAASIARYFIAQKRAVGLLAYGERREAVQPDRGDRQLSKILETLAVIRAGGDVGIDRLLMAEGLSFGRNSVAVVLTPSADTAWVEALRDLSRRGVRGIGVVVDPSSFGSRRRATGVLQALVETGILAYRVREGDSLAAALSAPASPS
ncbi:MAG TPA: DUF58 domain-containing protein [Anaerolineae bacterium]|nr:DUF58 domain-containing protein [Anaerolineae bacterium]HOQ98755.1 DUF58 domain-containing protein [Anaerolineae bacterium]HPL29163.1 DUF58 domain-containing protein [Anaerolineae bacterium]